MKKENKKAAHAATITTKKKIFFSRCYKITSTLDFFYDNIINIWRECQVSCILRANIFSNKIKNL